MVCRNRQFFTPTIQLINTRHRRASTTQFEIAIHSTPVTHAKRLTASFSLGAKKGGREKLNAEKMEASRTRGLIGLSLATSPNALGLCSRLPQGGSPMAPGDGDPAAHPMAQLVNRTTQRTKSWPANRRVSG